MFWLIKSTWLNSGRKKCLSLTFYKKYLLGYLTMITAMANYTLINISPEGVRIYRSPRLRLHTAKRRNSP